MKNLIFILFVFFSISFYGNNRENVPEENQKESIKTTKTVFNTDTIDGCEWVKLKKEEVLKKLGINDEECRKLFDECTEAFTDFYINAYEKLRTLYKDKEKDEKYAEYYAYVENTYEIRAMNCAIGFQKCIGL